MVVTELAASEPTAHLSEEFHTFLRLVGIWEP